jgi:hypothetical protein
MKESDAPPVCRGIGVGWSVREDGPPNRALSLSGDTVWQLGERNADPQRNQLSVFTSQRDSLG